MTGRRGFTLIEVVVVMVIVVITIGLVGPRIGAGLGRLEMNTAAQATRGILRVARLQAERTERPQYVMFDRIRHSVLLVNDAMRPTKETPLPSSVEIVLEGDARTAALSVMPSGIVRGTTVRLRSGTREVAFP